MSASKLGKIAVIGLSAAVLAGCSTTGSENDSSTSSAANSASETYAAGQAGSVDGEGSISIDSLIGVETVFYFDFDKSVVRPASREALAKHAAYLVANPSARLVLEGHADERGTREYNMALGERRAKAISRYLTIQGVALSQIETVSFGEEVPVAFGHEDSSWQLNRRVEARYEK